MSAKVIDSGLLDILEVAHDLAVKGVRSIRISGDATNHFAAMLYLEIIEFAGSLILLRRYSRVAGVSIIARTALDAFVDLKNLLIDDKYWASLELADSVEWAKILQTASVEGNQYLDGFRKDANFALYRKIMKTKLKATKAANAVRLKAEDKFIKAGMLNDYWGLYVALSADVHNNTSHLKYRHMRAKKDGFSVTLYTGDGGYGDAVLLTMSEILMFASEDIQERYGAGKNEIKGIRYVVDPARDRASKADKRLRRA
jgi:Family of unknown function (DUF5677)